MEEKDGNGDVCAFNNESHEVALDSHQTVGPYSDEPIASELWMPKYNVHRHEAEEEEKENELLEQKKFRGRKCL